MKTNLMGMGSVVSIINTGHPYMEDLIIAVAFAFTIAVFIQSIISRVTGEEPALLFALLLSLSMGIVFLYFFTSNIFLTIFSLAVWVFLGYMYFKKYWLKFKTAYAAEKKKIN
ncbi:MAG: hypothetical protein ACYCUW_01825 [bacterium]